ncbi:Hypothetical predicted protein [Lynx pardinus]|uniref:L1 transposable element RRM domain-containing protein n=1 Tax=Lynx pardinus TaxID=191816 RepID=A0A485PA11_LYNPA|nr:Hypothetical predicted protein [Lynx pardinus]
MKEQDKVMARDLSKTNVSNMANGEFKAVIIRILTGLLKKKFNVYSFFEREREEILIAEIKERKKETKMKNAITEIRTRLAAMSTKPEEVEEGISDTEDKIVENNETEQKRKKNYGTENRLRELSGYIKCSNIHIIGIPEEEVREKGAENLFEEIVAKNLPNLGKETDIKI